MKHEFRFLASPLGQSKWRIDAEEFFHLKKVLRMKCGDVLEVFDGKGTVARGEIEELSSQAAVVRASEETMVEEMLPRLGLCVGALKAQSMPDLLPCLVELGVNTVDVFLSEGEAKSRVLPKYKERWERIILAATKQSKRAYIPEVRLWASLDEWLSGNTETYKRRYVLDPEAKRNLSRIHIVKDEDICVVVGSEKGLSRNELDRLQEEGFEPSSIGSFVLRSVTAAISACAVIEASRRSYMETELPDS